MTNLYVPHTSLNKATRIFLTSSLHTPVPVTLVDVSANSWAYLDYMSLIWDRGEDFINMEHDIVPWPGAVHSLVKCDAPWCFFGYLHNVSFYGDHQNSPVFGLTRFRSEFIASMPDVWKLMRVVYRDHPQPWRYLDIHMAKYARYKGWRPHQHWPPVLNANPKILDRRFHQLHPTLKPEDL